MNYGIKIGKTNKKWVFMHPGKRAVTTTITEEQYDNLQKLRNAYNKIPYYAEFDDKFDFSVSSIAKLAIEEFIENNLDVIEDET